LLVFNRKNSGYDLVPAIPGRLANMQLDAVLSFAAVTLTQITNYWKWRKSSIQMNWRLRSLTVHLKVVMI